MKLIEKNTKDCPICLTSFVQLQCSQVYCTRKCKSTNENIKRRLERIKKKGMSPLKVNTCLTCKKTFPSNLNAKYCKANCRPSKRARKRLEKRKGTVKQKPKWCSWKLVEEFYSTRPSPNHELDHIIPLNHPNVSGLHIPANFQWLTKEENNKKSNKFDGTLDNESWRRG